MDFDGFRSEEGGSGCTACLICPLPSNDTSGGSLYSVQSANPTFFLEPPTVWFGDSAEDSGVKVELIEDRREEDSFWKKRPTRLVDSDSLW